MHILLMLKSLFHCFVFLVKLSQAMILFFALHILHNKINTISLTEMKLIHMMMDGAGGGLHRSEL